MSHDHMFSGCTGTCQQGRRPCDCRDEMANGWTRTRPGDLEPDHEDPDEEVPVLRIFIGLVLACMAVVLMVHAALQVELFA